MFKYMGNMVDAIQQSLKSQSVVIKESRECNEEVVVLGTTEGVEQAIQKLKEASDSILHKTLNVNKPGKRRFLAKVTTTTKLELSDVENKYRCIIDRNRTTPSSTAVFTGDKKRENAFDVFITVYAENMEALTNAERAIQDMVAENYKNQAIEHDAVGNLSTEQRKWIYQLQLKHDTIIKIEEEIGRIDIRGDTDDVLSSVSEANNLLAEMAKQVKWTSLESGEKTTVEGKEIRKGESFPVLCWLQLYRLMTSALQTASLLLQISINN